MINQLTGNILQVDRRKKDNIALLEINGIVYEIYIPSGLLDSIRYKIEQKKDNPINGKLTFYTVHYIEGGMGAGPMIPRLVGFLDPLDRDFFELFTSVSGLGVRTALKAMVIPINEIARAIETNNELQLDDLPEIGAATARKIIAELKGKMAKFALMKSSKALTSRTSSEQIFKTEAMTVLLQLQYSKMDAERLIENVLAKNRKIKDTEELIAEIFRSIGEQISAK